jgi:hypothetical protein
VQSSSGFGDLFYAGDWDQPVPQSILSTRFCHASGPPLTEHKKATRASADRSQQVYQAVTLTRNSVSKKGNRWGPF